MEGKPAPTVAVIGAGPAGLSMLKTLLEDGFAATLLERRGKVGGLWSYTDDKTMTTAMPTTTAFISKYTCGFTDYPMPDKYPDFLNQPQFQEYMDGYAEHFGLYKHIEFECFVRTVARNTDGSRWRIEFTRHGEDHSVEFDKVVFCSGYQTKSNMPQYAGAELFEGELIHAQAFRHPENYKGKNIVFVGLGPTASDLVGLTAPLAGAIYLSHRKGCLILSRYRNGIPADLAATKARRQLALAIQRYFPRLAYGLADFLIKFLAQRPYRKKFDPAWRLDDIRSTGIALAVLDERILDLMVAGRVKPVPAIARFTGPRSLELTDGTVLGDVDAVVCCTGYDSDFDLMPFMEFSKPEKDENGVPYGGPPIARLFMNLFPPAHADSIAVVTHSTLGKNNGFSFSDVISMAVSNVWRGVSADMIPSRAEMERRVDAHHAWVASRWQVDHTCNVGIVKTWEFQSFLHQAAGTGMENLGWGWKGWRFWLKDPKMSRLMNHGIETAHAFRYFETGKRRTWPGAREAIIHMNDLVRKLPKRK